MFFLMSILIPHRGPTREELTLLRRSFDHWGIFDFVLDKEILIREKSYNGTENKGGIFNHKR